MKRLLAIFALFATGIAVAQTRKSIVDNPPAAQNTANLNCSYFVGPFYATVQSAVTAAHAGCASAEVVLPIGSTPSDGAVTSNTFASVSTGYSNVQIRDERGPQHACFTWQSTVFSSNGVYCSAGAAGSPGATPVISTVATGLSAGSSPTATTSGPAATPTITFGIPAGTSGTSGTNGTNGTNGSNGAAATIAVGTVTTGAAGSSAVVTNAGSSAAATLNFTIPKGDTGAAGSAGTNGTNGTIACSGTCTATYIPECSSADCATVTNSPLQDASGSGWTGVKLTSGSGEFLMELNNSTHAFNLSMEDASSDSYQVISYPGTPGTMEISEYDSSGDSIQHIVSADAESAWVTSYGNNAGIGGSATEASAYFSDETSGYNVQVAASDTSASTTYEASTGNSLLVSVENGIDSIVSTPESGSKAYFSLVQTHGGDSVLDMLSDDAGNEFKADMGNNGNASVQFIGYGQFCISDLDCTGQLAGAGNLYFGAYGFIASDEADSATNMSPEGFYVMEFGGGASNLVTIDSTMFDYDYSYDFNIDGGTGIVKNSQWAGTGVRYLCVNSSGQSFPSATVCTASTNPY